MSTLPDTKCQATTQGTRLELQNISKRFNETAAVSGVSLTVQPGELCCLLGPSGCGKSTILRLIAGLESPDNGRLLIDDRDMHGIPPRHRHIGMVFQNYALFPHMNIYDNIAYGLACTRQSRKSIQRKVQQMLEMIHLTGYEARSVNDLSGGEQQRVALARALVTNPKLLLLDEPFSNLDARLREAMRDELNELQKELGITTILVTHDQEEAMSLADNITLMRDGCIEQTGPARDIYSSPKSFFVANFLGHINLFSADSFRQQLSYFLPEITDIETRKIGVRPESLTLSTQGNGALARVDSTAFHGKYIRYRLTLVEGSANKSELIVERPVDEHNFSTGDQVTISLLNDNIHLL